MEKKLRIPDGGLFNLGKENISESASTDSTSDIKSASTNASAKANTFKIKRGIKKDRRTMVTYRLNSETVERIDEIALEARKSINETVQELLDWALDNVDVE
jgi:hypothetical protein